MFGKMIVCNINKDGVIRHVHKGSHITVGVASTPTDSKLICAIEYEEYAPDGLQKLINHALLHKCIPDELFEFNVWYN